MNHLSGSNFINNLQIKFLLQFPNIIHGDELLRTERTSLGGGGGRTCLCLVVMSFVAVIPNIEIKYLLSMRRRKEREDRRRLRNGNMKKKVVSWKLSTVAAESSV